MDCNLCSECRAYTSVEDVHLCDKCLGLSDESGIRTDDDAQRVSCERDVLEGPTTAGDATATAIGAVAMHGPCDRCGQLTAAGVGSGLSLCGSCFDKYFDNAQGASASSAVACASLGAASHTQSDMVDDVVNLLASPHGVADWAKASQLCRGKPSADHRSA